MKRHANLIAVLVLTATLVGGKPAHADGDLESLIQNINARLAANGVDAEIGNIDMYTLGWGVREGRTLHFFARWVPFDSRRGADGAALRYLVRQGPGATSSGLSNAVTESQIDTSLATWDRDSCMSNAPIVKRVDPGVDVDIFDELIERGDSASPDFRLFSQRPADIIEGGFRPRAFFDWFAPGGGAYILGMTIQFFYGHVDINHDGYRDMVFTETYYNDNFAWSDGGSLPTVDVQTVALHENGHALLLSHFGPPPVAVMNPTYRGIQRAPFASDHAGLCVMWGGWPDR